MKHKFIALLFGLLLTWNCFGSESIDHIIAAVNDDIITAHEFEAHCKSLMARQGAKNLADENQIRKEILSQMINQRLQYQIALDEDIQVSDEEVKRTIHKLAQAENLSDQAYIQKIIETGLSKQEFFQQMKMEMAVNRLQQSEISAKITVSDEEINHYLRTVYRIEKMKREGRYDEEELNQLTTDERTRAELQQLIYRLKFEQKLRQWLEEQRANAYIKIYDKKLE